MVERPDVALSKRQAAILSAIGRYWRQRGYAPTVRDLTVRCVISSTSVTDYNLRLLEECGLVVRDQGVGRSIRLTAAGWAAAGLEAPCCGGCR